MGVDVGEVRTAPQEVRTAPQVELVTTWGGVMRRPFVIGIILCLGAVVVPATVSGAAAHRGHAAAHRGHKAPTGTATVTVDPSSGLLDGQTVAVTGNNFTAK